MSDAGNPQPPLTYLYLDDSGSRNPDHGNGQSTARFDCFAMGGFLVDAEHHDALAASVRDFTARWDFEPPLHSVRIRGRRKNFAWLGQVSDGEASRFLSELSALVTSAPITVVGCVVDRPGYNARYRHLYEGRRWKMCKTAFTITVERAARLALSRGRRLRVVCEATARVEDSAIRDYYRDLRAEGMPFNPATSAVYNPLSGEDFRRLLAGLDFKGKKSEHMQVADLVLYPVARSGYEPDYRSFREMRDAGRLIDCQIPPQDSVLMGIKYSCFAALTPA
jgi:hypothetical protein